MVIIRPLNYWYNLSPFREGRMKCSNCGNFGMKKSFNNWENAKFLWNGKHHTIPIIKSIPCLKCKKCFCIYYDNESDDVIQKAMDKYKSFSS